MRRRRRLYVVPDRPTEPDGLDQTADVPAVSVAGAAVVRGLARDYVEAGEPVSELYAHLDRLHEADELAEPEDALVRFAGLTWAQQFTSTLRRLTCRDPLTGLSSSDHLLMGLDERLAPTGDERLSLIVIDVVSRRADPPEWKELGLVTMMRLSVIATVLHRECSGPGIADAMLTPHRVGVIMPSDPRNGDLAARLRAKSNARLRQDPDGHSVRVRVVDLPAEAGTARGLVEELM